MIKGIIINADDFGLKSSVNKAIVDSFSNGLINSTTLMVNMPGFDEAVELTHKNKITTKTGIHLTLTEGQPVTSDILNSRLFYSGDIYGLKKYKESLFFLSKDEKILIYKEFAAQIEKAKKARIQISHLDTHHHIEEVWPITKIILAILKTHNIPSMRTLNTLNMSTMLHKIAYRNMIKILIKSHRADFSDFFGNQFEGLSLLRDEISKCNNKKLEIMVHPDYNTTGILINRIQDQEIIFNYPEDLKKTIDLHAHMSVY